jgi:hypothetical protein
MFEFSNWLDQTRISVAIKTVGWVIPAVQSIHILCICIVLGSILTIGLRVWGAFLMSVRLEDVAQRFYPWLWTALSGLLLTGVILIVAEPIRELFSLAFWIKIGLIIVGGVVSAWFQLHVRRHGAKWDTNAYSRGITRSVTVLTFVVWLAIAVMGRWIAFDTTVFGNLSPHNHLPDVP